MRTTLARLGGAIAVLLAFLVPTLTLSAASAAPAAMSCVGVIVDSGQGKPGTDCIPYTAGLTGAKALEQAGHKLAFASSGLLCQIDGYPAACKSDNTHYWAYDIRKPGATAWGYATQGPTTQKVKPGETDGLVYVNGKDRKPADISYASIAAAAAPSDSTAPSSAAPSSTHAKTVSTSEARDKGSSHTGLIIAIVVVVVLVVAAGLQLMLRRRRAS